MNMTPQEYQQYVKQKAPKSPLLKDTVLAFVAVSYTHLTLPTKA